uniref:Uncharacterized protein LOC104224508 isoform X2 n=1 Tax=Nicotiana sylvestris TaxID=4096 RepID=A0A1U7WB78_NICSY|nr:PREDICTED: uncharacterized protein LOC104224508 isoform X2 [Nicotiana sylvestris]
MQHTADQSKRFQEAIVMKKMKKPLFFTIWEDLASNEGAEVLRQVRQLQEYLIILEKRIGGSFYVEGEISLPENFQRFYLLGCSECNHLVRNKIKREIQCINCRLPRMLIPMWHFEVEITGETGTITATMSEGLGERILSMIAEQIYDITGVKNELFLVAHINQLLADTLFRVQLQRSSSRTPDKNACSLVLLSYTEKPTMFLLEESTSMSGAGRIMEEEPILVTDARATKKQKREPSTLPKPQSRLETQTPYFTIY